MTTYANMSASQLQEELKVQQAAYDAHKAKGLSLNMARGKPASNQLELSLPILDILGPDSNLTASDGTDLCNYGCLTGLPEARALMATMLDDKPENVIVFGNSSLNIMYDTIARFWAFGTLGSTPWCKLDSVKFLCPVPGYDRHFGVTEAFGIELICVDLNDDGPDMDAVEELVANDASIKGIWCVPKYSNPTGITYSDEVVRRLASMPTAADDFRIMWDNAYTVHHLSNDPAQQDQLLDIAVACEEAGTQDRYFKFASTSKVTLPGAGISAMAASPANVAEVKTRMGAQAIGYDKLNQMRHVLFLKDAQGIAGHMAKHAAIIAPKFELTIRKLEEGLGECGVGAWTKPRGGYFISFDAMEGTAKHVVALAKEAGVTMTGAGATYPYKRDPHDANIRIAPTLPPLEELETALDVFITCVKLAAVQKLLEA